MSDLILLPSAATLASGGFASDTGVWRLAAGQTQRMTLAAALNESRRPVVLLHPADARLAQVKVPPMNRERSLRAAALALDEQLLGESGSLQVALGERIGDLLRIALVDRALITSLRTLLGQLGAAQAPIGPLAAALPPTQMPALWGVDGEIFLFSTEATLSLPPEDAATVLALGATATGTTYGLAPLDGWTTGGSLPPLQVPSILFSNGQAGKQLWKAWRAPSYLAAACALAALAGLSLWWQALNGEATRLQDSMRAQFVKALPGTPMTSSPVEQLRAALTGGSGASTFERLLEASDRAAASWPRDLLQGADYGNERLTLRFAAKGLDASAKTQIESSLKGVGLNAQWTGETTALVTAGSAR